MEPHRQASPFALLLPTRPKLSEAHRGEPGEDEEGLDAGERESQTYSLEAFYAEPQKPSKVLNQTQPHVSRCTEGCRSKTNILTTVKTHLLIGKFVALVG